MRLIDADSIDYDDYWYNKGFSIRDCQKAQQLINEQPTVEERKVGKWILIDEESNTWQCSHCKELGKDDWWQLNSGTPQDNKMDYCPHCGTEMRGNENGRDNNKFI